VTSAVNRDRLTLSLWSGSPLERLYRSVGLADDEFELVRRRVFVLLSMTWLPLLALTAVEGRAWGGITMPFLRDAGVQAKLLIALPLLIGGEVLVHRRVPDTVKQFVDRRIVAGAARPAFDEAVESAVALSRSAAAEVLSLACVLGIGIGLGGLLSFAAPSGVTWYGEPAASPAVLTLAGWWYALISRPLFQFVLIRWYYRLFIWARFLWRVSRLDLNLIPTHPDRRAGLGFLSVVAYAFLPFLCAHGAILAGMIANGVVYTGASLATYQVELVAGPIVALLLVVGPEMVFSPRLWAAKRTALLEYGALAERYVREFEKKWLRGQTSASDSLLGTADIQSLADLGNSLAVIERMRLIPLTRDTLAILAAATTLPLAALALTVISVSELLDRLLKILL
jgi:hypothetical protein